MFKEPMACAAPGCNGSPNFHPRYCDRCMQQGTPRFNEMFDKSSDDCWDGFSWRGWQHTRAQGKPPRPCAVYTGTSDREVLDSLARGE